MPPSRGLLSSAVNGARLQIKSRSPQICAAQRQFSTRLSTIPQSSSTSTLRTNPSLGRPRLQAAPLGLVTSRAISLWPFGSAASSGSSSDFKNLHKAPPTSEQAATSAAAADVPTTSASSITTTSTTPTDTQQASTAASATSDSTPLDIKLLNLDDITPIVPDVHTLPEKIGHFHELGLNFGWGPSSMIEWLLEHVHIYTGTPWWGSIIITAALVRIAFIPLIIKQSDQMARGAPLKDELDKIRKKRAAAVASADQRLQLEAMQEQKHLNAVAGLDIKWSFLPLLLQIPVGFGTFKFMRAAAEVPVPGWETGGFSWITDLTQTDPLLITPFVFFALMHITGRLGGETGMTQPPPYMRGMMLWGMPAIVSAFMFYMPVALQLSFITSMVFSFGSSFILRNPAVRERLGIAPMPKKKAPTVEDFNADLVGLNLVPTYQPPRKISSKSAVVDKEKKGFVAQKMDGFKSGVQQATEDLRGKVNFLQPSTKEDKSNRGKTYMRQADLYEARKKKQIEYEKKNR